MIFELDCVVTVTAPDAVEALDSAVPLLRRLRDVGVATAIYSHSQDCAQVLRAAGIDELVSVLFDEEAAGKLDPAVLAETASRLGARPVRCVAIERQFEGYSELAELDWEHYRQRYGNIQWLDRILAAENTV